MLKKLAVPVLSAVFLITPLTASAQTMADLQAQIQALLAQIATLQAHQTTPPNPGQPDDYGTGSASGSSCPNLSITMQRGSRDATTGGQVTELQVFLADRYGLSEEDVVTGFFGKTTHAYVVRFQQETNLPTFGIVGQLTRAKIVEVCGSLPPQPQQPVATLSASPTSGPAPLEVYFQGNGSVLTSDAYISFGDGMNGGDRSLNVYHVYQNPGTYTAVLHKSKATPEVVATATITVTEKGGARTSCAYRSNSSGIPNGTVIAADASFGECLRQCTTNRNEKYGLADSGLCIYTDRFGTETTAVVSSGTPVQTSPVVIDAFTASPDSIAKGQSIKLSWSSNLSDTDINYWGGFCNIEAVTSDNRTIQVHNGASGSGYVYYTPDSTATYTLLCSSDGKDGSPMAKRKVTVTVTQASASSTGSAVSAGSQPTNGFATLNPLSKGSGATLTKGNLTFSITTSGGLTFAPFGITSGKWYWEMWSGNALVLTGLIGYDVSVSQYVGQSARSWSYGSSNGNKNNNGSSVPWGNTYGTNDVIGVAFDADSGKLWFSKNGVWQASGDPTAGTNPAFSTGLTSGPYFPAASDNTGGTATGSFNFGQGGTTTVTYDSASGGYFKYTPPSGYKALSTANLPTPAINGNTGPLGTLSVSTDSSSPAYQVVAGGTTGVTLGAFRFSAGGESIRLERIGFYLNYLNGVYPTVYPTDIVQLKLYDGTTQIGTALFIADQYATFSTLSSPVTIAKDTSKIITVKADIAQIGAGQPGHAGSLIQIGVQSCSDESCKDGTGYGTGLSSGLRINQTGVTSLPAGVRISSPISLTPSTGSATQAASTLSPTDKGSGITLSNGNYSFSQGTKHTMGRASFGAPFGKWYWEVEANSESLIGWATQSAGLENFLGNDQYGWGYFSNGRVYHNVQLLGYSAPAADWSPWVSGDTLGFAYDGATNSMTVYKNNVLQGTITGLSADLSDAIYPAYGRGAGSGTFYFGQEGAGRTFYPSAGGYFKYAPPSGFQMLGGRLTTAASGKTAQLANALTALESALQTLLGKLKLPAF